MLETASLFGIQDRVHDARSLLNKIKEKNARRKSRNKYRSAHP